MLPRLLLFVLAIVIAVVSSSSAVDKPGARVAITTEGLNYLCIKGAELVKSYLSRVSIPDISGTDKVKLIITFTVEYKLFGIELHDVEIPKCRITPGSDGLTLSTNEVGLEVKAHLQVKHTSFPKIDLATKVKIDLKDISFSTTVYFGLDDSNGHATVSAKGCSANIGTVDISFSGGGSSIFNLLRKKFEQVIKSHFSSALCTFITKETERLGKKLDSSPFTARLDDFANLDYSLTQPPVYTTNYMAVSIKGEFYPLNKSNYTLPYSPSSLPPIHVRESMISVWITDYLVKTAGAALFESGKLSYTITPKLVPKNLPIGLNTTTLKFLIPSLYEHYPNMPVQIPIECTKPPQYSTSPAGASIAVFGNAKLEVIRPNETYAVAFVLSIKVTADLTASLENGHGGTLAILKGKVSNVDATFRLAHSNIGNFNTASLFEDLNFLLKSVLVPYINKIGKHGAKTPSFNGMHLTNPKLKFKDKYIVLTTDIKG